MFLNSWSLALTVVSLAVLFFVVVAGRTAIRVLRFWDPASDGRLQIALENEIWLSSTLIEYALGFQIFSLVLFILAADSYCHLIVGAMCATGSLLANPYGMPALLVKLVGVFVYGLWIVLHKFDIGVETYPLVRVKYGVFLALVPLLFTDILLQTFYIAQLRPDIITSCCGVVFDAANGSGNGNLLGAMGETAILLMFYGLAGLLVAIGFAARDRMPALCAIFGPLWCCFLGLALVAITTVFSSYIYAMPYHHCPFCILKPEYGYFGFLLYGILLPAAFLGMSTTVGYVLGRKTELQPAIQRWRRFSVTTSLVLLLLFVGLSSYHMVAYRLFGGEM